MGNGIDSGVNEATKVHSKELWVLLPRVPTGLSGASAVPTVQLQVLGTEAGFPATQVGFSAKGDSQVAQVGPLDLNLSNLSENFVAGNIAKARGAWESIASDPWILGVVQGVYSLEPQVSIPYPYMLSVQERMACGPELEKLERKGVGREVLLGGGTVFFEHFSQTKASWDFRLIFDLTELNKHKVYEHFKMTSLQTALDSMRPGWARWI